jgi:hypothetical protein
LFDFIKQLPNILRKQLCFGIEFFTYERGLEMSERMEQKNFKTAAIIGVISADRCNPNGDPGNNNRPRVHRIKGLEYGWISQYRIKRFIRDTAETLFDKKNLFRSGTAFN